MRVYFEDGTYESLNDNHFISQGGQGSVYGKDDLAYKIYTNPKDAISEKKIKELSKIGNDDIIKPEYALFNNKDVCIGYAMRKIDSKVSLCQLFNHSYKTKNNISNLTVCKLIEDIQNKVDNIHKEGILIVDFNEMNFLVDDNNYSRAYFIDVDSYKTPSFEAGAIAEHIKDRHTKGFTKESDWFSFSIIAFRLLTGLHPYKGRHKVYKNINDRMLANVSAFNSEVKLPAIVPSFDIIPNEFKHWLESVLEKGERSHPPNITGNVLVVPTFKVDKVTGLGNFTITVIKKYSNNISRYFETSSTPVVVTSDTTHLGNYEIREAYPYIHEEEDGKLYLINRPSGNSFNIFDYVNKKNVPNQMEGETLFNIGNKLCYKLKDSIYRLKVVSVGENALYQVKKSATYLKTLLRYSTMF